MITFLRNCLLIDGTEADPVENAGLVVEGERIVAAGAGAESKAADRTIDMHGMAVLPGLINLHTHYGLKLPGALSAMYASETQAGLAYRMAQNAREGLMVGVTTSRSTGEQRGVDFDLRRWIDSGRLPGPRMFTAGRGLAITGGHGSREAGLVIECDGPDEFRKAARGQIKEGADHIKIMISGGIAGEREAIADAQMAP